MAEWYRVSDKTCLMSYLGMTDANPIDKTISLPFFSPIGGGVWGGAEQKIEKKMVLVGRSPEVRGRWRG